MSYSCQLITGTQHTFYIHSHGYAFLHSAILAQIMCVLFDSTGVKHQFHLATNKGGGVTGNGHGMLPYRFRVSLSIPGVRKVFHTCTGMADLSDRSQKAYFTRSVSWPIRRWYLTM